MIQLSRTCLVKLHIHTANVQYSVKYSVTEWTNSLSLIKSSVQFTIPVTCPLDGATGAARSLSLIVTERLRGLLMWVQECF